MTSWNVTETKDGVQFKVKLQPRAKKNEICGVQGEEMKVRLTSPPVEGEANDAFIKFLSKRLKIPRAHIKIASGHTNPHKIIHIEGIDKTTLMKNFDIMLNK